MAEAIDSGMVAINQGMICDPLCTIWGNKQSGIGREGSFDGIHEFLQTNKIVFIFRSCERLGIHPLRPG